MVILLHDCVDLYIIQRRYSELLRRFPVLLHCDGVGGYE